jgi:LmbE family N-acetylglucosaminyl deacetylase
MCRQPTIMNVVAHEDDDLLFLSPDLLHDIQSKDCVRTVYLTAGDAGGDKFYWLSRQLGAEAAYSTMLGIKNVWNQQTLILAPGEYVTVATPRDNMQVSLIFMNLPDGNLLGQGFPSYGRQSLMKLHEGAIPDMRTVDGESIYTSDQLVSALALLMDTYQPAEVHTQADAVASQFPDHSDHTAAGKFAALATAQYDQQHFGNSVSIPVKRYIGYPVHGFDNNVDGTDLTQKEDAFFAYGQYDGGACHTMVTCSQGTSVYQFYLPRQYQQ